MPQPDDLPVPRNGDEEVAAATAASTVFFASCLVDLQKKSMRFCQKPAASIVCRALGGDRRSDVLVSMSAMASMGTLEAMSGFSVSNSGSWSKPSFSCAIQLSLLTSGRIFGGLAGRGGFPSERRL